MTARKAIDAVMVITVRALFIGGSVVGLGIGGRSGWDWRVVALADCVCVRLPGCRPENPAGLSTSGVTRR